MALKHTNNTFSPATEFHTNDNHKLLTISFWNSFNNIVDSMVMKGRMAAREHCQGIKKSFRELQEKPSKAVCFYCPDIRRWCMRHWRHVKGENALIKRNPSQSCKLCQMIEATKSYLRFSMLPFARINSPGTYPVLSALTLPSMGPLAQQQQQSVLLSLIADGYCKVVQRWDLISCWTIITKHHELISFHTHNKLPQTWIVVLQKRCNNVLAIQ